MEAESLNANHPTGVLGRLLPAVGPVLLIAIGYIDPGKWASTIEGGARFGFDLVAPLLIFNFAAILCQYLSARISVVAGRDLAQDICSSDPMGMVDPVWTESNWDAIGVQVYTVQDAAFDRLVLLVGVAVTVWYCIYESLHHESLEAGLTSLFLVGFMKLIIHK